MVCVHPNNDTYPVFSIKLNDMQVKYMSKFDHDEVDVQMGNLQIIDHTCYPQTLDPSKQYPVDAELQSFVILSRRKTETACMFTMHMIMFHYPLERTCHIARKPEF
jgi:hypothetical protein